MSGKVATRTDRKEPARIEQRSYRVHFATALGQVVKLGDGSVAIPARISRWGVLEYTYDDGRKVNEYRPKDEVFSQASLDSFKGITLTDDHPAADVDPNTWKAVAIGHVCDDVRADGDYVACTVIIKHADAIARLDTGEPDELRECSAGYFCGVEETSGIGADGLEFQAIQRNIRGNHVALGPLNWGRAGNNVRLYLNARELPPKRKGDQMDEAKKKAILAMLQQLMQLFASEGTPAPTGEAPLEGDAKPTPPAAEGDDPKKVEASKDAAATVRAQAAADAAKAKADSLESSFDARVEQLFALREKAAAFGVEAKGRKPLDVMIDCVKKSDSKFDPAGKSPTYIEARFDCLEVGSEQAKADAAGDATVVSIFSSLANPTKAHADGGAGEDSRSPREIYMANQVKAHGL